MFKMLLDMIINNALVLMVFLAISVILAIKHKSFRFASLFLTLVAGAFVGFYYTNKYLFMDPTIYEAFVELFINTSTILTKLTQVLIANLVAVSKLSSIILILCDIVVSNILLFATVDLNECYIYMAEFVKVEFNLVLNNFKEVILNTKEKIEYKNNLSVYSYVYRV